MSMESMRVFAESTILSAMSGAYPSVKIKFDNVTFAQPDTTWTAFCVLDGKSFFTNLGTKKVDRHVGLIQFDVMVPENSGTSQANTIAEFGGRQFRNRKVTLSDGAVAIFQSPQIVNLSSQGGFARVCCRVPYHRDEPPN